MSLVVDFNGMTAGRNVWLEASQPLKLAQHLLGVFVGTRIILEIRLAACSICLISFREEFCRVCHAMAAASYL